MSPFRALWRASSTEPAPPRPARNWSVPLHVLMGGLVVASMLALAVLLMWQSRMAQRNALLEGARDGAHDIGVIINEKIGRELGSASAALQQFTFDPVTTAPTLGGRLARLRPLSQALVHNPLLSAVYVGYADGEFLLVRPLSTDALRAGFNAPLETAFLVQSITLDASRQPVGRWHFYDDELRPLGTVVRPDYRFDPRTRPWYLQAQGNHRQSLTDAYEFATTQNVGVTVAQAAADGGAVLGLDLALSDVGREIAAMRRTPHIEIAVVDAANRVLAYSDPARALTQDSTDASFPHLDELGVAPLTRLAQDTGPIGAPVSYRVNGEDWFGIALPMTSLPGHSLRILVTLPERDLLAGMRASLQRQLWWTLLLVLALLPLGWLAGRRVGLSLAGLERQAERLSRFRFDGTHDDPDGTDNAFDGTPGGGSAASRRKPARPSRVREVNKLDAVFADMSQTIQHFLGTAEIISREPSQDRMLAGVLEKLVRSTHCRWGAVYLLRDDPHGGEDSAHGALASHANRVGDCDHIDDAGALARNAVWVLPDQAAPEIPATGSVAELEATSEQAGRLALRLIGRDCQVLGLLVLSPSSHDARADEALRAFALQLSGALAVSIETRQLIDAQRRLLDAVIQLLADAIDAKSPYTGGHCERVPELAEAIIDQLRADDGGPFPGFRMDDAQRYEFRVGAWLHDCGKITSPEHIIDKATKLETIYNRIHEIRMRFEVLWRDADIAHLERVIAGEDVMDSEVTRNARWHALHNDFAFVAACNIGGESMDEVDLARLRALADQAWQRHFDNRLGLAAGELERFAGVPAPSLPATEPLLADRPEHAEPWGNRKPPVQRDDPANRWGFDMPAPAARQDMGELHNLSIRRGTLTPEDRYRVNDHIVQTYIMLRGLPWPRNLARVPEIAATHHERLDGRGYPRKLDASRLTVPDRVMALADVFEALTAADRPYKAPKPLSAAMEILAGMVRDHHLDGDVFRYFLRSRLWEDYARRYLRPEQIDTVDIDALAAMSTLSPAPRDTVTG